MSEKLYTGAVKHPGDDRNLIYDDLVFGAAPFEIDWDKGFDIRNVLGGEIERKDQKESLSCVGQAWAYYFWVKQVEEMMARYGMTLDELRVQHPEVVKELSAKAFYSQIFLASGGAYIMKGAALGVKWGAVFDSVVPSKDSNGAVSESFMRELSWKNTSVDEQAKILKGSEYRIIRATQNMDLFAQAIIQNHGVVGGVTGQNGRGWRTERPLPPIAGQDTWGHAVIFPAFGKDERGRFIATPNSWGWMDWMERWEPGAPPGYGMQKLYEDYFVDGLMFDPWTYVDPLNPDYNQNTMLELIKGDKKPDIYAIGLDGKLRHVGSWNSLQEGVEAGFGYSMIRQNTRSHRRKSMPCQRATMQGF